MQNKEKISIYILKNYLIVIIITMFFSYFLSIWSIIWSDFKFVFFLNSIWALGVFNLIFYPITSIILFNIILVIINYLLLLVMFYYTHKYDKLRMWYIFNIAILFISLLIWYFYQLAYIST